MVGQRHAASPPLPHAWLQCRLTTGRQVQESPHLWALSVLGGGGGSPQGPDKLRELGGWRASAKSSAQVQRQDYEHPPCFRPSLQLRQATNQGRQLWGRARGRGAVTASSGLGLGGCGQGPARRKREEASGKSGARGQGQPQRCPAGLEDIEQMRPRPSSPGQEAEGAGRGAGGGRQEDAWGCRARGPGERARETGTRAAPGWRREQAERKPGQGQRGKRQGADEIQEEEEVDEDEAGPPAGSGGGGGGGGREKRLAGS